MENAELMNSSSMELLEQVIVNGDLARLTPQQRLDYYRQVCQSMGLNPLSKPFDYINLKGKLTLYAKKDATDQLRKIHGVSIDDIDIQETSSGFRVKVKGHDRDGRSDVEIGCVAKNDMGGNLQNAEMKAVTKAKRRLTLSLCGLGWLDETEIETIPDARPVIVDSNTGEILEAQKHTKKAFDEKAYLLNFHPDESFGYMAPANARCVVNSEGKQYGDCTVEELARSLEGGKIRLRRNGLTQEQRDMTMHKLAAIQSVLGDIKAKTLTPEVNNDDPFVGGSK